MIKAGAGYSELHAHSAFSLLDGAASPEDLLERAAELGIFALALTDHDAVYGAPQFFAHARQVGVKPILGAEVTLADQSHLTLLAETEQGYRNLCQLITKGRMNSEKGHASLPWQALPEHAAGLICLSGCRKGRVAQWIAEGNREEAWHELMRLAQIFGAPNLYVEVQRNLRRYDLPISRRLAELAQATGVKLVATGNVHYARKEQAALQMALTSIRERVPLPQARLDILRPNFEYGLRSADSMYRLFHDLPQAVANTREVADRCNVTLPNGLQVLPEFPLPKDHSALSYLRGLCLERLPALYPQRRGQAREWLEKELRLIAHLGLANYFLIVHDIMAYCQRERIMAHGRGSAANSIVARLLGITAVDPIQQKLIVERFLSVEHGSTPDIDIDIDAARREDVIQYVYERWGRSHAAMASTFVTFRSASAIREAGFALGFKPETVERVARSLDALDEESETDPVIPALADASLKPRDWERLVSIATQLRGLPRHLGIHNGGLIITGPPIAERVPVEPARMENRTVTQWDKEGLEQQGLVKIDLLGLRMLAALSDTVMFVWRERGLRVDLQALDFREEAVFELIRSCQTIGLFQVESGAQVSIIPHLQPRTFQDLVVEVSLIRPGPLQGNMVKPYIRRRQGREPVTYPHLSLRPALELTLGVIVFQEQVIKIARDFAGFTPGRGELLRRALGGKNAGEKLSQFRAEFFKGASAKGTDRQTIRHVWQMLAGFAGYSFSQAHAAAFAVIVYWSAWLRLHYPAEYFCSLLRHSPLGTYPPGVLEWEAQRHDVRILPFDINHCNVLADIQGGAIRHGLNYVHSIGEERATRIVHARGNRPFASLVDFIQRTGFERRQVEALIQVGAFDALGSRPDLIWELARAYRLVQDPQPALFDVTPERPKLAPWSEEKRAAMTYRYARVTAGQPLMMYRTHAFTTAGCVPLRELRRRRDGARVTVGGGVMDGIRRPPTARGTAFLRLMDFEGYGAVDVTIPKDVFEKYRETLLSTVLLVVEGKLEKQAATASVVAERVMCL